MIVATDPVVSKLKCEYPSYKCFYVETITRMDDGDPEDVKVIRPTRSQLLKVEGASKSETFIVAIAPRRGVNLPVSVWGIVRGDILYDAVKHNKCIFRNHCRYIASVSQIKEDKETKKLWESYDLKTWNAKAKKPGARYGPLIIGSSVPSGDDWVGVEASKLEGFKAKKKFMVDYYMLSSKEQLEFRSKTRAS